jgi:hypothetical protein
MSGGSRKSITHMVGWINAAELELFGDDVRTLCGLTGSPTDGNQSRYTLTDSRGNAFTATTRTRMVTCNRCVYALEKDSCTKPAKKPSLTG